MKLNLYSFILSIAVLTLVSCKTASKMYEKGKYDEAVELAAKKLQKDPDDPKLLDIIRTSYKYASDDHQSRIRSHSESTSELKWEWIYQDYASLQKMYNAIYKVPSVYNIVMPVNYSAYMVTYGEKAAETRFNRGMSFMQRNNKQSFRNAYREFQMAATFKPGDREIISRMNEAYEYAVTNVIILPLQQDGGYVYSSYTLGGTNLDDELLNNLRFNSGNEFLKFYSAWDARSRNIRTDMLVDIQLSRIDLGHYHDHRDKRKVSKEVVVKETVIRPDSIVKEYAWVHAEITTTRRTLNSDARLRVNVSDADGRWLWSDNYNSAYAWSTEFSTYTGDSRALSASDKALVERRPEPVPDEREVMRCLIDDIRRNAENGLRNYFARF